MIPNMMADWDSNNEPQSPTITFEIRFPFPNSGNWESTSPEAQRSPRDFSFHLSIKMPTIQGPASTVHPPVLAYSSVDVQTQNARNAQQLEITLRERLQLQQQQRNNLTQSNPTYQRPRRTETSTLPTPPSTSNSERLSPIAGAENLTCGGMVYDADAEPRNPRPEVRQIATKVPEKSLNDKPRVVRNVDSQPNVSSYTKRRYSRTASRSPSRSPAPTKRPAVQKGREYRSRSRSYSPVDSKRGRSYSPAPRRSRSVDTEGNRGRRMEPKGLQRSPSPVLSSRDSSRSSQSRPRSRGEDACMRNRGKSTSTISHEDQLAIEMVSSGRYSQSPPPAHIQQPPTPSSGAGPGRKVQETPRKRIAGSLQLRISGESMNPRPVASKHARRRTCPFYHPTDKDRHPLDEPHPGYSIADFEEAVKLYEKGCVFPPRLIKQGVTINPKNRQIHTMRSPIKPKITPGFQNYALQSPQARNFQGRRQTARSRSPNESPAKRRKVGTPTSYYARAVPSGESRAYGAYPTHPTAKLRNAAPFRQEGPSPISYDSNVPNDYHQSTRFVGPSQQQRPAYGRQNPAPPTHVGNHRWH